MEFSIDTALQALGWLAFALTLTFAFAWFKKRG